MRREWKLVWLAVLVAVVLAGPVFWWISSKEVLLWSLPLNMLWIIGCTLATTLCLFLLEKDGQDKDEDASGEEM